MFQQGSILDGTYRIMGTIGSGGTGVIYQAYHMRLQKYVVIKKIKENCLTRINVRAETDILKELHHTYLPQIYDFFQDGTDVYTVMEYIRGYDLKHYMDSGYRFTEEQLLYWLRQLAEVLEYLHSRRPAIIHSDIKPENIMITTEGNVCLIDFNIALSGEGRDPKGISVYFASPEQTAAAFPASRGMVTNDIVLDGRTDLYSLGMTFYFLMTGYLPDALSMNNPPIESFDTGYSEGLLGVIARMTEPDKEKRYASASRLLYALDHLKAQGRRYRRLQIVRNAAIGCYVLCMVIFIMITVHGVHLQQKDHFLEQYQEMLAEYENGNTEDSLELGLEILNNSSYASVLRNNAQEESEIYELIGVIYAEQGDYGTACIYYEQAAESVEPDGSLYKSYAIALVRAGYLTEAESLLTQARVHQIADEDIFYIQAQIYWKQGVYDEAYSCLQSTLQLTGSSLSNREKRELAYFAYELAAELDGEEKGTLLETAESLYLSLIEQGYAGWNDYYNLAIVYETDEQYEEGRDVLLILTGSEWDQDYRVYAHLAVLSYRVAAAGGSTGDSTIRSYCRKAIEMAEEQGASDDSYLDVVESVLERVS